MARYTGNSGIDSAQVAFALGSTGVDKKLRPWAAVRAYDDRFQVKIETDGEGVAKKFRYYVAREGLEGLVLDNEVVITK